MLINTNIAFAIRCDMCGRLKVHSISMFDFLKEKNKELKCTCYHTNAIIKTRNCKTFCLEIPCFACQDTHVFTYNIKQFFKSNLIARCIETGMEIGFIGKHKDIQNLIARHEEMSLKAINELGFYDYFDNSDIVLKSISRIKELELQERIYCDCGMDDVKVNLFPDRIELNCISCNSVQMVYTQNKDDLQNLLNKDEIILHQHSFRCIDAINQNSDNYNR